MSGVTAQYRCLNKVGTCAIEESPDSETQPKLEYLELKQYIQTRRNLE